MTDGQFSGKMPADGGNVPAVEVAGRPNGDFDRSVWDECDLCAVSEDNEHTTCLWPAINDAAVRRPPFVPSPSRFDENVVGGRVGRGKREAARWWPA